MKNARDTGIELSIVVPFYNEEENIQALYGSLKKVLKDIGKNYELIFVDDGSKDNTPEILFDLQKNDHRVCIIQFRRNFGQSASIQAGFDYARGEYVITMDGDLQHDPQDIPALLAKAEEGYDVVSGWRKKRVDHWLLRRFPSFVANRIMARVSGMKLHDFGTTFKVYHSDVAKNVCLYGELHRFIPVLASGMGVKVAEVPIRNIVRAKGKSNYGLSRTIRVICDIILVKFLISYFSRPLQIFGLFGLLFFLAGAVTIAILSVMWLFFGLSMPENRGMLILAVMSVILGVQFFAIGLSTEISSRIYHEGQKKPIYAIREIRSTS